MSIEFEIFSTLTRWLAQGALLTAAVYAGFDGIGRIREARPFWQWLLIFAGSLFVVSYSFLLMQTTSVSRERASAYALPKPVMPRTASTPKVENPPTVPTTSNPTYTEPVSSNLILLGAPFSSQAPFGNWADLRQEDGCEETSALMAVRWAQGRSLTAAEAEREIIAISDYELATYGEFKETSAEDTAERILRGYFKYNNIEVRHGISVNDIRKELGNGHAVIVPVNGQFLPNPYYTPPGPRDHMILVQGYDPATREFITNDPSTRFGEKFRYKETDLQAALQDYLTGDHEPLPPGKTAMIVVRPAN